MGVSRQIDAKAHAQLLLLPRRPLSVHLSVPHECPSIYMSPIWDAFTRQLARMRMVWEPACAWCVAKAVLHTDASMPTAACRSMVMLHAIASLMFVRVDPPQLLRRWVDGEQPARFRGACGDHTLAQHHAAARGRPKQRTRHGMPPPHVV